MGDCSIAFEFFFIFSQARNVSENYPIELFLEKAQQEPQQLNQNVTKNMTKHNETIGSDSTEQEMDVLPKDTDEAKPVQFQEALQKVAGASKQQAPNVDLKADTPKQVGDITGTKELIATTITQPQTSTITENPIQTRREISATEATKQATNRPTLTLSEVTDSIQTSDPHQNTMSNVVETFIDDPAPKDEGSIGSYDEIMEANTEHSNSDLGAVFSFWDSEERTETNAASSLVVNSLLHQVFRFLKLAVNSVI